MKYDEAEHKEAIDEGLQISDNKWKNRSYRWKAQALRLSLHWKTETSKKEDYSQYINRGLLTPKNGIFFSLEANDDDFGHAHFQLRMRLMFWVQGDKAADLTSSALNMGITNDPAPACKMDEA